MSIYPHHLIIKTRHCTSYTSILKQSRIKYKYKIESSSINNFRSTITESILIILKKVALTVANGEISLKMVLAIYVALNAKCF